MKFSKVLLLIFSLFYIQYSFATTWYLDSDDSLKNDDIPELTIRNKDNKFIFYMNHKELPLSKKGNLAPTTASAPLIDSVVGKNKICIEATEGANGPAQNIRNIYIIGLTH